MNWCILSFWRRVTKDPVRQDSLGTVLADVYHFASDMSIGTKALNGKTERLERLIDEEDREEVEHG